MTPSPTESNVRAALRSFLLDVLPSGTEVIVAQQNRVPEPRVGSFVLMTPLRLERLETNIDSSADVRFTGSISGTTLTVTEMDFGTILVGATVFGVGVTANTKIMALGTGTGGTGTYTVSPSQTVASETLSAGSKIIEQHEIFVMQLDFHSDALGDSADMATVVAMTMRDEYAADQFANQVPYYGVVPLYADDPAQRVFVNDSSQYESRWVVDAMLQANPIIVVPQQYADAVDVDVVSVEAEFPPT